MVNVWRLRMKSGLAHVDHVAARRYAIETGIVGAGWSLADGTDLPDRCAEFQQYRKAAIALHGGDDSLPGVADIFGLKMQPGDFCWLYATHLGEYWCARVLGNFEYRTGGDFDAHDLHMTRSCEWRRVGPADAVPGVIQRAFAGPFGTISALVNGIEPAIKLAEALFQADGNDNRSRDLFACASPEDLEDLAALYLQAQGWFLLPSTAKTTMASYEFVMVHSQSGHRAGVQVKSGNVGFLQQEVAIDFDAFFVLLAGNNARVGSSSNKIHMIIRGDVESFARQHWTLLPRRLQAKWLPA